MEWLNDYRLELVLVGITVVIVFCGRNAKADFVFGEPTNLGPTINSSSNDDGLTMSADGLSLFFGSDRPDRGDWDLYVATRETIEDEWGPAVNLGPIVNTPYSEGYPSISADGLELFFCSIYWQSQRPGGCGGADLWVTKRASISDPWGTPENLGPLVNSISHESDTSISSDGLELYFSSERSGGEGDNDLYVTTRPTKNDPWCAPVSLGPVLNSSSLDMNPCISADGLALFFRSSRPGGYGNSDIYLTTRGSTSDPWSEPVNLGPMINDSANQVAHYISPDGSTLYLDTGGPSMGGYDLWQVSIITIIDFNADGIVDSADLCIMVDYWGTDNSLCDIGPMPWGDGVVDVEDMKVLAEHLFEEVNDPTLLAHWKLDEEEGKTAYDSVGTNDGVIIGLPQWRPQEGIVDGALELNGTTFVTANSVLSPADGPFSVLAWVKGGAPGQVVVSQSGRTNWLMADATTGALMTELSHAGPGGSPLGPEVVITDGNWHRIALTWDGANLRLYVDSLLVTEHVQDGLADSSARLIFGTGKNRESGTYWSGLIDDIRNYNRAVSP